MMTNDLACVAGGWSLLTSLECIQSGQTGFTIHDYNLPPLANIAMVRMDATTLAFLGWSSSTYTNNTVFRLDIKTGSLTELPPLPQVRSTPVAGL